MGIEVIDELNFTTAGLVELFPRNSDNMVSQGKIIKLILIILFIEYKCVYCSKCPTCYA